MYLSGIRDREPIAHGVVSRVGGMEVHSPLDLTGTVPANEGTMLIDTGAQVSVLDVEIAISLGLPETGAPTRIIGVTGDAQLSRQFTGTLHLPAWNISRPTTFVAIPLQEQSGLLGIIGMDFLIEFVLTIHGPNGTINIEPP